MIDKKKYGNRYTPEQKNWLIANANQLFVAELVASFNFQFKSNATKYGLRHQCVALGITPKRKRTTKHHFAKGKSPYNVLPVGTERIEKRSGYTIIKTGLLGRKWEYKHVLVWEQHHKIKKPKAHTVIFLDGDKTNFEPENLHLVKISVLINAVRNGLDDYPADVKPSVLAMTELSHKLNKITVND
jgi:hypothetical protein